jgi:hypothetical protein
MCITSPAVVALRYTWKSKGSALAGDAVLCGQLQRGMLIEGGAEPGAAVHLEQQGANTGEITFAEIVHTFWSDSSESAL